MNQPILVRVLQGRSRVPHTNICNTVVTGGSTVAGRSVPIGRYPYITKEELGRMIPVAVQYKVSKKALSENQFVDNFLNHPTGLASDCFWIQKRNGFLARTLPAYRNNPTWRRYISLIIWAFNPEPTDVMYTKEEFDRFHIAPLPLISRSW